jgi:hypothetical protein
MNTKQVTAGGAATAEMLLKGGSLFFAPDGDGGAGGGAGAGNGNESSLQLDEHQTKFLTEKGIDMEKIKANDVPEIVKAAGFLAQSRGELAQLAATRDKETKTLKRQLAEHTKPPETVKGEDGKVNEEALDKLLKTAKTANLRGQVAELLKEKGMIDDKAYDLLTTDDPTDLKIKLAGLASPAVDIEAQITKGIDAGLMKIAQALGIAIDLSPKPTVGDGSTAPQGLEVMPQGDPVALKSFVEERNKAADKYRADQEAKTRPRY